MAKKRAYTLGDIIQENQAIKAQQPLTPEEMALSKEKEDIEKNIAGIPGGEFFYQMAQGGAIGAIKDWGNKFLLTKQEAETRKRAEEEVSKRISRESPILSGTATVAGLIPEIAATSGLSAVKAVPILSTISAGPRILEEPGQVAAEAAISAGAGKILDLGANYIGKVTSRRAASRAIPQQQQAIRAKNIAGAAQVEAENLAAQQKYNVLAKRAENENAALMHQHNLALNERQNKMIEAQNAYQRQLAEKGALEEGSKRLANEYKIAKDQYEKTLSEIPKLQKQAQADYSRDVVKNVEEIQRAFPRDSKILGNQIGTNQFIAEKINSSGLAGSREGAQAGRILKSLFPEGEIISSRELSKKYKALEDAIQRSTPEVQGVLSSFKNYLGERLPSILQDTIAHQKIIPKLETQIQKDITKVIHEIPFGKGKDITTKKLIDEANLNLKQLIREISPENFIQKMENGEISNLLRDKLLPLEDFLSISAPDISQLKKAGLSGLAEQELSKKHAYFLNEISNKINNSIARNEINAMSAGKEAANKFKTSVKKTYGLAEPVNIPKAPKAPEPLVYPSPTPPEALPMPLKPTEIVPPSKVSPKSFESEIEPVLEAPQNSQERLGDFLEKSLLGKNGLLKGKGITNNPLTKLAGLKFLLGKAAIPAEAAYLGLKGITSPTSGGEIARLSFKQAGIQSIVQLAQKYPSFHDGIIENPQERRSLTKEIEIDPEIPIEQKAIIQSKINRGIPLQNRI